MATDDDPGELSSPQDPAGPTASGVDSRDGDADLTGADLGETSGDAPSSAERTDMSDRVLAQTNRQLSLVGKAALAGLAAVIGLGAVNGWLAYRNYQGRADLQQRASFVQAARQGAVNLTTISWEHAEADVERVLKSATGRFYDDFQNRSKPFIDVVKKAQSKSEGTVTEAGLESQSGDSAEVLLSVRVNTSNIGAVEQEPRYWRMRMSVEKDGEDVKVSNVVFVP